MPKNKLPKSTMEPKEYRAMLKSVELQGIWLEECSAKLRRDKADQSPVEVSLKDKISHQVLSDNIFTITHTHDLVAGSGENKDFVLKINSTFKLRYSFEEPLSDEFFEVFKERNVPLNTWPYLREFIQNMVQRMNLPPLTLPLLKS